MKELRINFLDTFDNAKLFWIWLLEKEYDVSIDPENPQLLIFGDRNFGNEHSKYSNKVKKLFYTGENVRPYWSECDWAVSFEHINSPKHYRLPLYVLETWAITQEGYDFDYLFNKHLNDLDSLVNRPFCSFVQKNPNV